MHKTCPDLINLFLFQGAKVEIEAIAVLGEVVDVGSPKM